MHRWSRFVVCSVVAGIVICADEAHTSQVHHRPIQLAEVVRFSDVVVVATAAVPPTRTVAVDITPRGQRPDPQKWPPYQRTWRRFVVDEVIVDHGTVDTTPTKGLAALKKGAVIEVLEATDGETFANHRSHYVDGMSESPIHSMYEAPGTTTSKARILILRRSPTGFSFATSGAEEHVENRASVDAAIKGAVAHGAGR